MKKSISARIKSLTYEAVVIGVSSGGIDALKILLPCLSADFAAAVIVVQHRHSDSGNLLVQVLQEHCQIVVKEAEEKEPIRPGIVYLSPANYHLLIEADRTFAFCVSEKVNYARPAIDVLFETAADEYQNNLIGIILTGANHDGSQGLKKIKQHGGLTIVQDPTTAEAEIMPKAAMAATTIDYILPLQEIGFLLNHIVGGKYGSA
jgi:two-component system chemotaxis response regulator CheB